MPVTGKPVGFIDADGTSTDPTGSTPVVGVVDATLFESGHTRAASGSGTDMLAVGIVLDTHTPPEWIVTLLDGLVAHPRLRPHVFLTDKEASEASAAGAPAKAPSRALTEPARTPGGRVAGAIVRSTLVDSPRHAPHARRARALPAGLAVTSVSARRGVSGDIDVLLDAGVRDAALERRLSGTPLWSARVERLEERVERALLASAPLFWLHLWRGETGSPDAELERFASHALPLQSHSLTDLTEAAFRALPAVLTGRLNWLAHGHDPRAIEAASQPGDDARTDDGDEAVFRDEHDAAIRDACHGHDGTDGRGGWHDALAALRLLGRRRLKGLDNRVSHELWELAAIVGTDERSRASVLERIKGVRLERWRAIDSPRNRIWADPHLCRHDGETFVFFEELAPGDPHGHISVARLDADGARISAARRVLVEPFHLSYPFVFEHDGEHWMIPETASRRTVSLYRATRFPDEWRHECDLLDDVDLADSTLHRHAGRWWLFTSRFSDRAVTKRDELLIYHADTLTGPWRPHALNPVITGIDRARMAGPVFEDGGRHYRPSQYGAVRYGHGINIARIETLTPELYRETPITRLLPGSGSGWLGCHSLASAGPLSVVDRFERRWRW